MIEQGLTLSSLNFMMTEGEFSDVDSKLPFMNKEEDHDPSPYPSGRAAKPNFFESQTFLNGQPSHENPSSPELDSDMLNVCKCSAAELNIQWLEV